MLFCAFLLLASLTLTDVRPSSIEEPFLRATSIQKDLPGRCFSVQLSLTFFRKRARPGSSHAPSYNSSYSCSAAHFFQYTDRALCTSIFLTSFGHTNLKFCVIAENQCVPVKPFYAQITGLTQHCSCRPCHLLPRLNCSNLPHPRFFLLVTPFSYLYSFCPVLRSHGGKLLLNSEAICFHEQGQRGCTLLPAVAAICLLNFDLSVTSLRHGLPKFLLASYLHVTTS